jgi:hypothetical protein
MPEKKSLVSKEHFINKLRALQFTFNRQGARVELWRQRGTGNIISVPTNKLIPEAHVRLSLHQCGCGKAEVDAFISAAKS